MLGLGITLTTSEAWSQWRVPSVGTASYLRASPSPDPLEYRIKAATRQQVVAQDTCRLSRPAGAALGALGGAFAGWFLFTVGPGILASDRGSEYRRMRSRFVVGGGAIGTVLGALRPPVDRRCRRASITPE